MRGRGELQILRRRERHDSGDAGAMAFTAVSAVCDMVRALSDGVRAAIPGWESVDKLYSMLPLSENGMGWVIPATVGTIVGLIIMAATRGSKTGGEVA